jgi:ankyrin repeat protein
MENIIYNKDVNKLLYSGNANKELLYNKNQMESLKKATRITLKRNAFSSQLVTSQNLFLKKKKAEMLGIIKDYILESKKNKSDRKIYLEKKNKSFEKLTEKENILQQELYYKRENDIKIQGYKRAVQTCLNKSNKNSKFKIPDISLNINDAFSRLYNNIILNPGNLRSKNNNLKKTETTNLNNTGFIKLQKIKIKKKNYSKSESKNKYFSNINIEQKNKYDKYKVKNVLSGNQGKEFSSEKNFKDVTKCIKKISGGPMSKRKLYNRMIKRIFLENKLNSKEKKFNVNTYRDENNNSFLNIAVKNNNEKFVKYFLTKKYNPNEKNNKGNTALHLSMITKNRKIIKLLLDKDADITIKNKEGMTSYDLADKDLRKEFKMENILVAKKPVKFY